MIQIIKGTFGYYNGRKVIPITEADGPQKLDSELEARLVKEGIAEYVDTDHANGNAAFSGNNSPKYSEGMKLDELKAVAASYGIDTTTMRKKSDIIAAIEIAASETDADDEEPPQIGVADPV